MMYSTEQRYLDDGKATGFIKPYKSGYSFVALLPNGDISLSDYVASMTGKSFIDTIKSAKDVPVGTAIPKFSYDYDIEMSGALKALGMTLPFDAAKADFSALGSSDSGNIFISRVLQRRISPWMKKAQKPCRRPCPESPAGSPSAGRRSFYHLRVDSLVRPVYMTWLQKPIIKSIYSGTARM